MAVYYDADISGQGTADLVGAAATVQWLVFHTTAVGSAARQLESTDADHNLRMGWLSFGRNVNVIGATARDYWMRPIYIDFKDFRWLPFPNTSAGALLGVNATRLRWSLQGGATGHLYISGA